MEPATKVSGYTDYFGNGVEFFSLPYRHRSLVITSRTEIQTHAPHAPTEALEVSIDETRQILASTPLEIFDYLQPTDTVVKSRDSLLWARRHLRGNRPLGEALEALNMAVYETFAYVSGSTTNSTPSAVDLAAAQRGLSGFHAHHAQRAAHGGAAVALCLRVHRGGGAPERGGDNTLGAPVGPWSAPWRPTPGLR